MSDLQLQLLAPPTYTYNVWPTMTKSSTVIQVRVGRGLALSNFWDPNIMSTWYDTEQPNSVPGLSSQNCAQDNFYKVHHAPHPDARVRASGTK